MGITILKKKLILLASILLYTPMLSFSQESKEIGIFLGGSSYFGEINQLGEFYSPSPAVGFIYRKTKNPHYSIKYGLTASRLSGSDSDFSNSNEYKAMRNHTMAENSIIDFIIQTEFNFLPITYTEDRDNFAPYVHLGIGGFMALETSPLLQLAIPFGAGIKFKLSEKIEVRAEYIYHRTFTDKLDNTPEKAVDVNFINKQLSEKNNNDNFAVYGISFLYTFKRQQMQCHVFDKPR